MIQFDKSRIEKLFSSSLVGNLLVTFAGNGCLALLGLVTGVLVARLLGPQGRGELAAIQTWPTNIASLAMLGLAEATVYFSAREPRQAGRHLSSAIALALLLSPPVGLIAYLLMPVLLSAQSVHVIQAARWYLLLIPVMALVGMPFNALRGRSDFLIWNALRLTPNIGWLIVLIAACSLRAATPQWLAGTFLVVLSLLFVPVFVVTRRRVPGPFTPDYRLWRPMLSYGAPSAVGSVPQMFNLRLDQMLMAALFAPRQLGLYVVAVAWSGAAAPAASAIGAVAFPRVASQRLAAAGAETLGQTIRLGILACACVGGVVLILAPVGIPLLFGARFAPAIPAALILTVAGAVLGLNVILEEGVRGLGDTRVILWSELAGLVTTIAALALLLRPLGIVGAAIASLLAYVAVCVSLVIQVRSKIGCSATNLLRPRRADFLFVRQRLLAILKG
ncbi:MAG: hypothetical protein DMG38_04255 [Acidobacteria bacterium]|nr:MAG: hypothetical protein DMG38_04255 [Acidobacteriota bacterium]